jgi:RecG-like helicase
MMMMFKTVNNNSKYALEILPFLFFHQSSYALRTSYQTIHGLFVNKQGRIDSSIPADLHMEHMVKKTKSMLKSLGSNKTPEVIIKRSKALAGIDAISHQYDTSTRVIVRSQRHKTKSAADDEKRMVKDIHDIHPFQITPGRNFEYFKGLSAPLLFSINSQHYEAWIQHHQSILDYDSGK